MQWSIGGLFFLWITSRLKLVGLGYGWILRPIFISLAIAAAALGLDNQPAGFVALSLTVASASCLALGQSISRKSAGVSGQAQLAEHRSKRVAEMTGIERSSKRKDSSQLEFDPRLDLVAPLLGLIGLLAIGLTNEPLLEVLRIVVGALFLGATTDAMLLGHWYLVQPGLKRAPLKEITYWTAGLWLAESLLFLIPTGMVSVFTGSINDGYGGLLGWFWGACVITTIGLLAMTLAALKEKQYAAVMAATGLLYLSILTAFGMDIVARALLA